MIKCLYRLRIIYYRRPWLYPDFMFYLSPVGRQFKRNCDYVHGVADDIIKKRRETLVRFYIFLVAVIN